MPAHFTISVNDDRHEERSTQSDHSRAPVADSSRFSTNLVSVCVTNVTRAGSFGCFIVVIVPTPLLISSNEQHSHRYIRTEQPIQPPTRHIAAVHSRWPRVTPTCHTLSPRMDGAITRSPLVLSRGPSVSNTAGTPAVPLTIARALAASVAPWW